MRISDWSSDVCSSDLGDRSADRLRGEAGVTMAATTSTARRTAPRRDRFLGVPVAPITHRRLVNFRANRRGWWSLWIFLALFFVSLFAEFVANSKPIVVSYDGALYWPIFQAYPETTFGGEFRSEEPTSELQSLM